MHFYCFGDIVQNQWLHCFRAILEEVALVFDDFAGHFHQGFVAALQAFQKPACLLQVVSQEGVVRAVVSPLDQAGVAAVDADARRNVRIEFHPPAPILLADKNVRNDIFCSVCSHSLAGKGL